VIYGVLTAMILALPVQDIQDRNALLAVALISLRDSACLLVQMDFRKILAISHAKSVSNSLMLIASHASPPARHVFPLKSQQKLVPV